MCLYLTWRTLPLVSASTFSSLMLTLRGPLHRFKCTWSALEFTLYRSDDVVRRYKVISIKNAFIHINASYDPLIPEEPVLAGCRVSGIIGLRELKDNRNNILKVGYQKHGNHKRPQDLGNIKIRSRTPDQSGCGQHPLSTPRWPFESITTPRTAIKTSKRAET